MKSNHILRQYVYNDVIVPLREVGLMVYIAGKRNHMDTRVRCAITSYGNTAEYMNTQDVITHIIDLMMNKCPFIQIDMKHHHQVFPIIKGIYSNIMIVRSDGFILTVIIHNRFNLNLLSLSAKFRHDIDQLLIEMVRFIENREFSSISSGDDDLRRT